MKKMTYIAIMAVLIVICSWITVPFTVPFTMQTFAVFCAVLILGGKEGTASVGLYLILGLVGLPVFSGFQGGITHLLGPTGGYIIGFVFSGIIYMLFEPLINKNKKFKWPALTLGLAACYLIGTLWFVVVCSAKGNAYSFTSALMLCVLPYIIPDAVKMILAVFISDKVKKAVFKS